MSSNPDPEIDGTDAPIEFPESVATGTTVLLCGFDPTEYALGLRALAQFGGPEDDAVVVTTTRGAEPTIERYDSLAPADSTPSLRVVDMVSEGQSISATYGEVPTVFTPSQGDTERLVLALSELTGRKVIDGERHLVVRSLSPMLSAASTARVTDVLDRISGLRTADGLAVFALDYTAHDEDTVSTVAETADRVCWVTKRADGRFETDLRSTRAAVGRPVGE
ncbi:DUF7504 family protein [Halorientalis halophila]|uniref:DUF7504 family protein n=1 Tax=Halorientalis halophila TaxID=3108499 RepID=UPI00300BC3C2